MSLQIVPLKIDWRPFLRSFPVPVKNSEATEFDKQFDWVLELNTELKWNDSSYNFAWSGHYEVLRDKLPWRILLATETFVQTTTVYPIRKKRVQFSGFKPPCKYSESDFLEHGEINIFPALSPGGIVDVLAYFDSVPKEEIVLELQRAWEETTKKRQQKVSHLFENFEEYWQYLENWETILRELKSGSFGFSMLCL